MKPQSIDALWDIPFGGLSQYACSSLLPKLLLDVGAPCLCCDTDYSTPREGGLGTDSRRLDAQGRILEHHVPAFLLFLGHPGGWWGTRPTPLVPRGVCLSPC